MHSVYTISVQMYVCVCVYYVSPECNSGLHMCNEKVGGSKYPYADEGQSS